MLQLPLLHRLCSKPLSTSSNLRPPVAVFWDLSTSKPPTSLPPYDAAVRLHLAAASFGPLSLSLAYPTSHSLAALPHRSHPQPLHRLHSSSPHLCRICSRNFSDRSKLLNHFHQIHTAEHTKRLDRLNRLHSTRRANLAAKLSLKIKKYQKAAREIVAVDERIPYSLTDELKRAGVLVRTTNGRVEDDIVGEMDRRRFGCMVLVSGNEGFVRVLEEAEMRGLMTVVVVGDGEEEGRRVLRRSADVGFSWKDVVLGKARKAAGNAVRKWEDKGVLKGLEWRYEEDECDDGFEAESEDDSGSLNLVANEGNAPWWKLDDKDGEVQNLQDNKIS